jgi:hypothetical protein
LFVIDPKHKYISKLKAEMIEIGLKEIVDVDNNQIRKLLKFTWHHKPYFGKIIIIGIIIMIVIILFE